MQITIRNLQFELDVDCGRCVDRRRNCFAEFEFQFKVNKFSRLRWSTEIEVNYLGTSRRASIVQTGATGGTAVFWFFQWSAASSFIAGLITVEPKLEFDF